MTARTDVHSPKNLITEDYDFAFCYSTKVDGAILLAGNTPPSHERFAALAADGWTHAEGSFAGSCDHCGAHPIYRAVLLHRPSHQWIQVGETCLENRFDRATVEFQALRKQAALDRQKQRIKHAREAWAADHPDEFGFLADNHDGDQFYGSLWRSLHNYGDLSPRQLSALQASIIRDAERKVERDAKAAREAAQAAGDPDPTPVPDTDDRITISGRITRSYTKRYEFGVSRHVMIVLDHRGFKLWGTVPSSLYGQVAALDADDPRNQGEGLENLRITFDAAVKRSDDDDTFGFYSRPTKARLCGEVLV